VRAPVAGNETCKTFRIPLKKSTVRLETFFADANDVVRGAYSVHQTTKERDVMKQLRSPSRL